jgi:hypothetical protein
MALSPMVKKAKAMEDAEAQEYQNEAFNLPERWRSGTLYAVRGRVLMDLTRSDLEALHDQLVKELPAEPGLDNPAHRAQADELELVEAELVHRDEG